MPAILLNNQQYCWQYCQQYGWISNIADNVVSNIASNISRNIADQPYCHLYCRKISNIVDNIAGNIVMNFAVSAILLTISLEILLTIQQYWWHYCWLFSNIAGNIVDYSAILLAVLLIIHFSSPSFLTPRHFATQAKCHPHIIPLHTNQGIWQPNISQPRQFATPVILTPTYFAIKALSYSTIYPNCHDLIESLLLLSPARILDGRARLSWLGYKKKTFFNKTTFMETCGDWEKVASRPTVLLEIFLKIQNLFCRFAELNCLRVGWTKFLFYELGQQERGQGSAV